MYWEKFSFLVTDNTFVLDQKVQCDINSQEAKMSKLSAGKIDKYEHLTGEELIPPQQHGIIQEAKFSWYPLRKVLGKQTKNIEKHCKN